MQISLSVFSNVYIISLIFVLHLLEPPRKRRGIVVSCKGNGSGKNHHSYLRWLEVLCFLGTTVLAGVVCKDLHFFFYFILL